jgi:hypothetical protein
MKRARHYVREKFAEIEKDEWEMLALAREHKFYDATYSKVPITGPWDRLADNLTPVPLGSGESQRHGEFIHVRGLHFRFKIRLYPQNVETNTASMYRILVYLDKQNNKAASGPTHTALVKGSHILAFQNMNHRGRFLFLKDHIDTINSAGLGVGGGGYGYWDGVQGVTGVTHTTILAGERYNYHEFFFRTNIVIAWDDSVGEGTGAIEAITSNCLGIYVAADTGDPAMDVECHSRVYYTDN